MPIHEHRYPNGLVLVAESMQSLESVAFTFLLPVGSAYDPADRAGLTSMTCEMALRGCGDLDSRQYVERLESLGIETGEAVTVSHTCYRSAMLAEHLQEAIGLYGDLLLRPRLPVDELESSRQVAVQEYRALDDELLQKVMVELRRGHYPAPWGQSHHGNLEGLAHIKMEDIRNHFAGGYRPNGTILGVAGKFSWDELQESVGQVFGDWETGDWLEPDDGVLKVHRNHLEHDSNQTQIALAYPSIPYKHEDYFQAWGAVGVLSEGSSSRLFTEVREKKRPLLFGWRIDAIAEGTWQRILSRGYDGRTGSGNIGRHDCGVGKTGGRNRGGRTGSTESEDEKFVDYVSGVEHGPGRCSGPGLVSPGTRSSA